MTTAHVRTGNKDSVGDIVKKAELHGFTKSSKLVEYIAFYSSGTIKLPQPHSKVFEHKDFDRKWALAEHE
ncbi:MAG: hypothetical protein KME04_18800 [Pleurocapsa minor GSE-CHR-MK-17-07R]|nr:hypothetical protein [Pleurocapsa minor GSE-CHR-MK 17-07R]